MGSYGILLVIVLVLVSGLIAYLGDVLGRRLGRRRVTLFGLRPRYTAIAFSVVAGMAITLLTLLAAAVISEKVRVGLTQVDAMRSQMSQLKAELRKNQSVLVAAEARTKAAEQARQAEAQRLAETRSRMGQVAAKLQKADSRLQAVDAEMRSVAAHLRGSQERLQVVQSQFSRVNDELELRKKQVKKGEENALRVGRELLAAERQRDELAQQRDALTGEVAHLQERAESLRIEGEGLQSEVARLNALVGAARPALTEEVIFEVGEELGRQVISCNQPITAIRQQLDEFLAGVEAKVRRAGAGGGANGRAMILAQALTQTGSRIVYDDSDLLEMLARRIHAPDGTMVVRVFCLLNIARGSPAPVDLTVVPNRLLFSKGDKLATISLNPEKSEAELLVDIVSWLRDKVATSARRQNILPDLPPGGEKALLFGTNRDAVGRISPDRLFSLLKQIKRRHGLVQVTARAGQDTWTAGPLEVELTIEETAATSHL